MSYEGYIQHLCSKGHLFERDAYNYDNDNCPHCGTKSVWNNHVDQTNDDGFPYTKFVEITPVETCECGCKGIITPVTYRIPTAAEMEEYNREGRDHWKDMYYDGDWDDDGAFEGGYFEAYRDHRDGDIPIYSLKTKKDIAQEMFDCIENCDLKGAELYAYILGMIEENMDLKT